MSKIILDAELKAKLNGLNEQIEICDEDGRAVGQFLPMDLYLLLAYAWAKSLPPGEDRAQIQREYREGKGYTTAQAIEYVQKLARSWEGAMKQSFNVIWRRRLLETDITEYVVSAMQGHHDLQKLTAAMNEVESLLGSDPNSTGESRDEFERVVIIPPLTVYFEVYEDEKVVFINRVQLIASHP